MLGLLVGLWLHDRPWPGADDLLQGLDVVGVVWTNSLRVTVMPLIGALVIGAIVNSERGGLGRMGLGAFAGFLLFLSIGAGLTATLAPMALAHLQIDPAAAQRLNRLASVNPAPMGETGFSAFVKTLAPANIFKTAADGALLPFVLFCAAFALAARAATPKTRESIAGAAEAVREVMFIIVRAVLALAPIGVFALAAVLAAHMGGAVFADLALFIATVAGLLTLTFVGVAITGVVVGRIPVRRYFLGVAQPMAIAAGTKSSLAALPAMIDQCTGVWGVSRSAADLILPLAASVFKNGAPVAYLCYVILIGKLYAVPISEPQILFAAVYGVALSFTVPGIPGGGALAVAPLFASLGLPSEGLGLMLALAMISEIFNTALNVGADMTVTAIVARWIQSGTPDAGDR